MAERDVSGRFVKGHSVWSKGLTKEVEPRLAEVARKTSIAQKGVPEKDWVKEQLSEVVTKWHEEHPGIGKAGRLKQLAKRWLDPQQHIKTSQRMKGAGNPAWKGGISKLEYSEAFNADLKKAVKDKHGWKCALCGTSRKEKILAVHHIDSNKLNNTLDNLVPLCQSCHARVQWRPKIFKGGK